MTYKKAIEILRDLCREDVVEGEIFDALDFAIYIMQQQMLAEAVRQVSK